MKIKQYFKQGFATLRENPVISMLSIAGTALAIAMIMVVMIVYEMKTANFKPETKRDRTLYITHGRYESPGNQSNWRTNFRVVKECFYPLQHAEAVTAVHEYRIRLVSAPGSNMEFKGDITYTDAGFWKVFDFHFLAGAPFTKEDVESAIHKAVINETLARKLYGTTDVIGQTVLVSFVEFTIAGVVSPVSTLAEAAYGEIWLPNTMLRAQVRPSDESTIGSYNCYILAASKKDIPLIQAEVQENIERFNTTLADGKYMLQGQPFTHFVQVMHQGREPEVSGTLIKYGIILLILLIVPAINLSSMTFSRMKKRMAEIGIRRAFGAPRMEIINHILAENFVMTLIGGLLGLALSYVAIGVMSQWLLQTKGYYLSEGMDFVSADMIVHPMVFVYTLLFCLVMNLLSAGIPAWRVSSGNIVTALNEQ